MATVIDTLAYKIIADTQGFTKGIVATKQELAVAKQVMKESVTDVQLYTAKQQALNQVHQKGLIDSKQYTEQLKKLNDERKKLEGSSRVESFQKLPVIGTLAKAAGEIPGVGTLVNEAISGGAASAAVAAIAPTAAALGSAMLAEFRSQADKMKEAQKQSELAGVGMQTFLVLSKQARDADEDVGKLVDALNKMRKAIGEAKAGSVEKQDAFTTLKLNAKELSKLKPEDAFFKISDALRNMRDPYQRAAWGAKIFEEGASALNETLRIGKQRFTELKETMTARGELFSADEAAAIVNANKEIDKLTASWEVLKRNAAIIATPAISRTITNANDALTPDRRVGLFDRSISAAKAIGDYVTLGQFSKVYDSAVSRAVSRFVPDYKPPKLKKDGLPEDQTSDDPMAAKAREALEKEKEIKKQATLSLKETVASLRVQSQYQTVSTDQAKIWLDAQKAGNMELGQQAITLLKQNEARKAEAEALKAMKIQVDTFGMAAGAAENLKLKQLGVAESTLAMLTASRNFMVVEQQRLDNSKKGADVLQAAWATVQQLNLQRQGDTDARGRAAEQAADMRRQYDLQRDVAKMRKEGASEQDIAAFESARKQANELARQQEQVNRRQKLVDEAKSATDAIRRPDEVYAEQIRKYNEMYQAGGLSIKQFLELKRRAGEEMARSLPGGDRRPGVEAVRFGSAGSEDVIYQAQRQFQAIQRAAAIDNVVQDELGKGGPKDTNVEHWDKQLTYQERIAAALEQMLRGQSQNMPAPTP